MRTRNLENWTIDRWRTEPRLRLTDFDGSEAAEQAPPLWKDLTCAWLIAMVLWGMAAAVLF